MSSYFITGVSKGLGLALVRLLASNPSNIVLGLARDMEATEKKLAGDGFKNVHILSGDITDEKALQTAATEAEKILGDKGLDVMINNAGYISDITSLESIRDLENDKELLIQDIYKSFDVNAVGTLKAVYAFLPLVRKGTQKKIVAISSGMGDVDFINDAKVFGSVPYGISKAALNILMAKLNVAYQDEGILCIAICPGEISRDTPPTFNDEQMAKVMKIVSVFRGYAPNYESYDPPTAAKNVMAAIDRSSLEAGFGGSFLSHNGTKKWM
ncbi:hypothetical protein B0I35DRAFT_485171 [Stachybotrys elegans]|uniref:NAD(P)-binding protein n=1 Tax=Stachybotrys elegans TaxID=80388 RepID=A0A8K0WIT2_9HYPO|nr:hypothetical protein B0I35DRAFT_485171 [Stachybotrys elegans]